MPDRDWITFQIDGRSVRAPDGELLLEAAKRGDVEIPFFCYERKLGPPVGACRMCMVEIEGMPKLQVSCATPVKDGMVVYTESDRVKAAQNAVVEFLLVNHPLDCPVCDKGGECPLQDISYGWGPGRSRFVEPKRNFPKPIALSPLVAIDRERCILCYRCVRFSQEIAEDNQLTFLERADHTFVGTFDGRPYVAPFSGNVIELCPVGALTSTAYRFRARPWDIEDSGTICTLCPSQCNVKLTVRDERVERVLAREHPDVDDGWLCDKGRFGYQSIHSAERIVAPLVRDGGHLRVTSWEHALETAAAGLRKAGAASAALAGGTTTNEEAFLLQKLFRAGLGSGNLDAGAGRALAPEVARLIARPELAARVSDLDRAAVVLVIGADPINDAPIVDLRIRKAVRRFGARLVVAASHPTALDGGAAERLWCVPGGEEALLRALQKAMTEVEKDRRPAGKTAGGLGDGTDAAEPPDGSGTHAGELPGQPEMIDFLARQSLEGLSNAAGSDLADVRDAAALLVGAESIVIVWGERIGDAGVRALSDLALLAGVDGGEGSGLIELPASANARGLREAGVAPALGPGLSEAEPGLGALAARDAAAQGELKAVYLLHSDPLRELPGGAAWDAALRSAFVVAHAQFATDAIERHADVLFPAESYAEKDGTVTHPDGRVQRLRPAIGHPSGVRAEWQVLAALAHMLGVDVSYATPGAVLQALAAESPLYRGLTLDEIGGRGVRWQERDEARAALAALGELGFGRPSDPKPTAEPSDGDLRLATMRDLWASAETERSPALDFLAPSQELQLSPADAERLGVAQGDEVDVASNGHSVRARVRLREAALAGTAYLIEGTSEQNANLLTDGDPVLVQVRKPA